MKTKKFNLTAKLINVANLLAKDINNEKARRSVKKVCVEIQAEEYSDKVYDFISALAKAQRVDLNSYKNYGFASDALALIAKRGAWNGKDHKSQELRNLFIQALSFSYGQANR